MVRKLKKKKYMVMWYRLLGDIEYYLFEYDKISVSKDDIAVFSPVLILRRGTREILKFNESHNYIQRINADGEIKNYIPNVVYFKPRSRYKEYTYTNLDKAKLVYECLEA